MYVSLRFDIYKIGRTFILHFSAPAFFFGLLHLAKPHTWDHFLQRRIHTLASLVGFPLPTSPQCPPSLALIWGCRYKGNTGHTWNSPLGSISLCFLLVLAKDDRVVRRWERGQRSKDWETHQPDSVGKWFFLTTLPHAVDMDGKLWDVMGSPSNKEGQGGFTVWLKWLGCPHGGLHSRILDCLLLDNLRVLFSGRFWT